MKMVDITEFEAHHRGAVQTVSAVPHLRLHCVELHRTALLLMDLICDLSKAEFLLGPLSSLSPSSRVEYPLPQEMVFLGALLAVCHYWNGRGSLWHLVRGRDSVVDGAVNPLCVVPAPFPVKYQSSYVHLALAECYLLTARVHDSVVRWNSLPEIECYPRRRPHTLKSNLRQLKAGHVSFKKRTLRPSTPLGAKFHAQSLGLL